MNIHPVSSGAGSLSAFAGVNELLNHLPVFALCVIEKPLQKETGYDLQDISTSLSIQVIGASSLPP